MALSAPFFILHKTASVTSRFSGILSIFAAKYLVKKKISLVGIDSPSIDLGLDSRFLVHHQLLDNGILILENLCNLEKISGVHFKLVVLPLKLKGATGSPVRAIAL